MMLSCVSSRSSCTSRNVVFGTQNDDPLHSNNIPGLLVTALVNFAVRPAADLRDDQEAVRNRFQALHKVICSRGH
jgi:hypothetical protein